MLSPDEQREQISAALDQAGVWNVAELREAQDRKIARLPPEILTLDPLQPLSVKHLTRVADLTRWFRRQLSLERPFTGDSEAELLLVIAAGIAVAAIPEREIRKDRMAIFKATIARGLWKPALWHVPAAIRSLAELVAAYPECLIHPQWPGPKAGVNGVEQSGATS